MKTIVYYGALALILLLGAQEAWADLVLYPTRIVLEKQQRAAQMELINTGDKPETYRISVVNRRMTETGEIVEAKDAQPGERFADEMIRYSPRQVTLQPGKAQTVRLSVRKPAGLAAGEYRSHLQFNRLPDAEGQSNLETINKTEPGQISVVLQALIGASIPVIVRQGKTAASVSLDGLRIEPPAKVEDAPMLAFDIKRDGNCSVYGDVVATFTPTGGPAVEVAKVSGVAVYVPNVLRRAKLALKLPEGINLKNGTLSLRYSERLDAGGKTLGQAELAVR